MAVPHRWTPSYGSPFGINIHQAGWNDDPKAVKAIRDLGVGWVRVDFNWFQFEPQKGKYNWQVGDGLVKVATRERWNIYATLAYVPAWASSDPKQRGIPKNIADWERFVETTVRRYRGKISHWGIWNEPNLQQFLYFPPGTKRSTKIATYIQKILLPGIRAVKRADPDAKVLAPDLAHLGGSRIPSRDESWQPWLEEVAKKAGKQLDFIAHHNYKDDYLRTFEGKMWPWEYPNVLDTLKNNGVPQRVWVSEIGWKTNEVSEQEQAANIKKLLGEMLARKWWQKTFFYELHDDPKIKEKWGLTKANFSRKAGWTAYRDFIRAHQPTADAGGHRNVRVGEAVTFDASKSRDPNGKPLRYTWDFDHRNGLSVQASGVKVTHRFSKPGTYLVTLTVKDEEGIEIGDRVTVKVSGTPQSSGAYPIVRAPSVSVDGELREWGAAPVITLGATEYTKLSGNYGGVSDLSAEVMWMWSPRGLFVAARVTDNTHRNNNQKDLWKGDSIQLALDIDGDRQGPGFDRDGDHEINLALVGGKGRFERTTQPRGQSAVPLVVVSQRVGKVTIYEAWLPTAGIVPLQPQAGYRFSLSFLINDDDGRGRKGWIAWTKGIGRSKDPREYRRVVLKAGAVNEVPPRREIPLEPVVDKEPLVSSESSQHNEPSPFDGGFEPVPKTDAASRDYGKRTQEVGASNNDGVPRLRDDFLRKVPEQAEPKEESGVGCSCESHGASMTILPWFLLWLWLYFWRMRGIHHSR